MGWDSALVQLPEALAQARLLVFMASQDICDHIAALLYPLLDANSDIDDLILNDLKWELWPRTQMLVGTRGVLAAEGVVARAHLRRVRSYRRGHGGCD
jgi:hypothetical protein